MLTPSQQALVDAIQTMLDADTRVDAAWLSGSLGRGGGDEFSDVDLLVLVKDGMIAPVSAEFVRDHSSVAEPGLVTPLYGGKVINVVTEDWRRFDLSFIEASELPRFDAGALIPLFNRVGREPPRQVRPPYRPASEKVLGIINNFLRTLGLAVVVVGREEYANALSGVDQLRRMAIDLMLEQNGVGPADRGGALHLNALITPEQRAALEALPPLSPDRASIIQGHEAVAALFLPRARALADEVGAPWPERFEAATRRHLEANLGLRI